MKFSVVVPVYNSEAFLHRCINSIINQNYDDYELILVDDGSTDSSRKICEHYQRSYEQIYLICQENSGPSAARNRGIDSARGEYVTFVDSDDWVCEGYFETLCRAVADDRDLIIFGRLHEANNEMILTTFPAVELSDKQQLLTYLEENYLRGDIASCTNKVFSRRLLADGNLRFPEGTVVEEDLLFVLGAIDHCNTLRVIEDGLYCYNRREVGSVTTKYNPKKYDCKLAAYRKELALAKKWESLQLEAIFHDNYLSCLSACINNLMYEACPLSRKEKLQEIRRFFRSNETILCLSWSKDLGLRSRVMVLLIRLRLVRISYWMHFWIFRLRRRNA